MSWQHHKGVNSTDGSKTYNTYIFLCHWLAWCCGETVAEWRMCNLRRFVFLTVWVKGTERERGGGLDVGNLSFFMIKLGYEVCVGGISYFTLFHECCIHWRTCRQESWCFPQCLMKLPWKWTTPWAPLIAASYLPSRSALCSLTVYLQHCHLDV